MGAIRIVSVQEPHASCGAGPLRQPQAELVQLGLRECLAKETWTTGFKDWGITYLARFMDFLAFLWSSSGPLQLGMSEPQLANTPWVVAGLLVRQVGLADVGTGSIAKILVHQTD